MKTIQQIQAITDNLWAEYQKIFPTLNQYNTPIIKINNRLSKTAGRNFMETNIVELSGKYLAQYESNMLKVILPHELAHQIDWNINGWYDRKPYHGKPWIIIMNKIGQNPEVYHTMQLK